MKLSQFLQEIFFLFFFHFLGLVSYSQSLSVIQKFEEEAVSKVKSINRRDRKESAQRTQGFVFQHFDFAPFAITSCTLRLKKTFETASPFESARDSIRAREFIMRNPVSGIKEDLFDINLFPD